MRYGYKEFLTSCKKDYKLDIKYSCIFLILFNALIYCSGNQVTTYLYAVISAALAIVFSIDYRFQLIPDEVHIVIFLCGIVHLFLDLPHWYTYILGAIIGGGIFWGLGLLALLILKKEGMGFGDVKLMTALGFMFGIKYTLVITLVSFFLGAIIGGIILLIKRQDSDGYMPFGPFIVVATILLMFIPADYIIEIYINFCSWLGMCMTDVIYYFIK